MRPPDLSVVIPVYNEEAGLAALFARLYPALDALGAVLRGDLRRRRQPRPSAALLREQFQKRPEVTRVVLLAGNFGQHLAIMAAFAQCRGARVVTLDADLQNPPEEIAKLLAKMDQGHDYVGAMRRQRQDSWLAARALAPDEPPARTHHQHPHDRPGLHAARLRPRASSTRSTSASEANTFIPALAYTFARHPAEIEVAHEERAAGASKYSMLQAGRGSTST